MKRKVLGVVALAATTAVVVAGCSSSSPSGKSSSTAAAGGKTVAWSTAQSAQAGGGQAALVAAAKKEGALNVIALPPTWANYAAIIASFKKQYGITVTSENPDGSSGDEINALKSTKGQASAPDVVDVGNSYAVSGAQEGLYAPYKVATWSDIPAGQKDTGGLWASDYGGYISIGCNATKIKVCPTTIKQLDNPAYKGKVALNGDPTSANAAFEAVWAAALANGGSATDIQPGINFFKKLNSEGIFNKTKVFPSTVASGATPIVLDWDYLNAAEIPTPEGQGTSPGRSPTRPTAWCPGTTRRRSTSTPRTRPQPACGRSTSTARRPTDGQNGWLAGFARPIELVAMQANGSADKTLLAKIPPVTGDSKPFNPTQAQITAAKAVVTAKWAAAVSG